MIIIAEGTEREIEVELKPHVGKEGRKKDNRLLQFVNTIQGAENQMDVFASEEFDEIAGEVLDLTPEQMETVTKFELIGGFQKAVELRLSAAGITNEEVQTALKK